ncbi:MAG TPA: DNA-directed RNA polymerase subunit H [Methanosarcinaceae archaeon]|nr:DNA-directed RNA polymerase subunit H [Methanosarcinaceae archaeon]
MRKFRLLDHNSVPKHEIMQEDEIKVLLNTYQIDKERLPKIKGIKKSVEKVGKKVTKKVGKKISDKGVDPVVIELGAKIGDVIKITRISQTAGESLYYRLVIE